MSVRTDNQREAIFQYLEHHPGTTPSELARTLEIPRTTVRRILGMLDEYESRHFENGASQPTIEVTDMKVPVTDWRELLQHADKTKELVGATRFGQSRATIKLYTNLPVIWVFSSDWHIGSYGVEYGKLVTHVDELLNTSHAYLCDLGDGIDNFVRFKSVLAVLNQVYPPDVQKRIYRSILREIHEARRFLFRTWSNHYEEFDERAFGGLQDDDMADLLYLQDEGLVTIQIGSESYTILAKHTGRGGGQDRFARHRRAYHDVHAADVVAFGHTHISDISTYSHGEQTSVFIQAGTFKMEDLYTLRHYGLPELGVPCVVAFPDTHKLVPFESLTDARIYRDSIVRRMYADIARKENYGFA